MKTDDALWNRALTVIPSGTQTFSKAPFQHVDGVAPKYLRSGKGSKVWDLDGNEYLDQILGLGPVVLGHSDPELADYLHKIMSEVGVCLSLPHEIEVHLAEKLISLIPSAEMVRFAKNGSDVTSGAVRAARSFTGRSHIACSGYHGWHDWFIGSTSRNSGVPEEVASLTHAFKLNDIGSFQKLIVPCAKELAAIIIEPLGGQSVTTEFLLFLRDFCDENNIVLIFDEVISGFRQSLTGAQGIFDVKPDLSCFGKAMGNGFPISALVGRSDIMSELDEAFFSFTFAGEIVGLFAAFKTMELIEERGTLQKINSFGERFIHAIQEHIVLVEMDSCFNIGGPSFWPMFSFNDTGRNSPLELQTLFRQELIRQSILTRPGLFFSGAHTDSDLDKLINAFENALKKVKNSIDSDTVLTQIDGKIVTPVIRG